jgi:acetyl esterase/lipase
MGSSAGALGAAWLVAVLAVLGWGAARAGAALPSLPSVAPPVSAVTVAPVAASSTADPAVGAPVGTVILVHGGAWAGHSAIGQQRVMASAGRMFLGRGWRVVSIDYEAGKPGLQNLLHAAETELARNTGSGPLCIYGESAGAHLALVAASRLGGIDCVIGIGTPTDLARYESEGAVSANVDVRIAADQIARYFGTSASALAPWSPVLFARTLQADVLLLHETDDPLVSASYAERFQSELPTTRVVELEAGDPSDPSTHFAHGTVSAAGRALYTSTIGAFADQAKTARDAERSAARTGCPGVGTSSISVSGSRTLATALRCLAHSGARALPSRFGAWRRSILTISGKIDAARLWARLRRTTSGRRALAACRDRRTDLAVHTGDPSRVILRRTRRT